MSQIRLKCDKCKEFLDHKSVWCICDVCYGNEKKELIGEFLPHLDWALNELYPTHFNNEEYNDAVRFLKKWGE